ncbi:30S ribosomal protein S13 [Candidatus Woesearchaeota archaeon]|nr:30S ribosomal protein S13 [Candidatus Woesearchaeota archaeon]
MNKMAQRYIIRVANTDLDGKKPIGHALTKIKGVSIMLSNALCKVGGIDSTRKAGDLSEAEEKQLNVIVRDPKKAGIPEWMMNRRKDPETGENMHLIGPDVKFVSDNDVKKERKLKSYRGMRHAMGLPVRGQRTKSNFRRNKTRGSSRLKALRRK